MAEKKIVGVRYSDAVNADLYIDPDTNLLTKAVNNVNNQTIPSGSGDFTTAKVTLKGYSGDEYDPYDFTSPYKAPIPVVDNDTLQAQYLPETDEEIIDVPLYKGVLSIDGFDGSIEPIVDGSGNIAFTYNHDPKETGELPIAAIITGDCTIFLGYGK